jgi:hypothetical protein
MATQTLSDAIIYGTNELVAQAVSAGATLDEIDNYGYTPIVQCAIVNSVEKAKILLDAGAKVDFDDLTGRTALHWAADNGNVELCKLLLSRGASPNAYSRAGQSALVMPLLRRNEPIKKLLYENGASLTFAQDFINGKLLGHRFELEGRVDVIDNEGAFIEIEFEGFYLEFTLALVVESIMQFKNNFSAKHLRAYFDQFNIIIDALYAASRIIKYQHYMVDVKQYQDEIDRLIDRSPLVIPVVYSGHAICFITFGDFLIRCDRGAYGRDHGTVIIFKMGHPERFNKDFIRNLLYTRQDKHTIDEGLPQHLGLRVVGTLPLSEQISGNCTWANVEAVMPTLLFLLLLQSQRDAATIDMHKAQEEALAIYEEWLAFDKDRALTFCMQNFYQVNPARKATKAAIVAAVLFQDYDYENPADRERADKMMPILIDPNYVYILKVYVEVFQYDRDNPLFQNLLKFIDYFDIDLKS